MIDPHADQKDYKVSLDLRREASVAYAHRAPYKFS
jgi:hypothetical protein